LHEYHAIGGLPAQILLNSAFISFGTFSGEKNCGLVAEESFQICMRYSRLITALGIIKHARYNLLEDQDVDGWTILKWILER
jgi:hypothetical protein